MNSCPSEAKLRSLLAETLPACENADLAAHVQTCSHCQATLERLTTDSVIAPFDRRPSSTSPGLLQFMAAAAPPASEDERAPRLDFLESPVEPDSLGRLKHYQVLEVLGRGGFGIVLRTFDGQLRRVVALKVLSPELAVKALSRQRFLREARSAAAVRHPNVVQIHTIEEQPIPYLVMELIPGETLQQRLDRLGPLQAAEVVAVGRQVADGLAAAHAAGLIHRDVKPANILLEAGPPLQVKLTDFGLARTAEDFSLTHSGVVAGSPLFMSPEQARGSSLDHRTDLFSLGSVLYTLTTGRPPFQAANTLAILQHVAEKTPQPIPEIVPETPAWLCRLISRLMAKDPEQRFQTAAEVAVALETGPASPKTVAAAEPSAVRWPQWQWMAGSMLVLAAILAGTMFWLTHGQSAQPFAIDPVGKERDRREASALTPESHAPAPEEPGTADTPRGRNISPGLLATAGRGNPAETPKDLGAILGNNEPFPSPVNGERARPKETCDGKLLALPCGPRVFLYDARTGQFQRVLEGHNKRVADVAFSPDGSQLASFSDDATVKVWDVSTGQKIQDLPTTASSAWCLAFSPDGRYLAAGFFTRLTNAPVHRARILLWPTASWTGKEILNARSVSIRSLGFSPDSGRLVGGAANGDVFILDVHPKVMVLPSRKLPGAVVQICYSPDGKWLALGTKDECQVWDAHTLECLLTISASAQALLCFSSDSQALLTGRHDCQAGAEHEVFRWDAITGKEQLGRLRLPRKGGLPLYSLSHDQKTLFVTTVGPEEDYVRAYDSASGQKRLLSR